MTARPGRSRVAQQARNFSMVLAEQPDRPTHLLIDHDPKFVPEFDRVFAAEGVEVKRVGPKAPNLNAYAEHWVQAVKRECLDHFIVFGEAHLRHLLVEYVAPYNQEHPTRRATTSPWAPPGPGGGEVCRERLGGLLKHYSGTCQGASA